MPPSTYTSVLFEAHRERLVTAGRGGDVEDPDAYRRDHVFWVPVEARWSRLSESERRPLEGRRIDGAMEAVERDNPALLGALPKIYSRSSLEAAKLGELVDLIGTIGLGAPSSRSRDMMRKRVWL